MAQLDALRLYDMPDRELLHVVNDLADNDGWAAHGALTDRLGINHKHPGNCVGVRMGWMKKYGFIVSEYIDGERHYRLTTNGEQLMKGKLTPSVQKALDKMGEGDMMVLMRETTGRFRTMTPEASTMMRREWQRGALMRRNGI